MKKRVLSLLLVLLLSVCALSACGEEEPPTLPPSNETDSDLAFTLKEDGTYAVSAGKLIAEETIEIPAEYNGKSVTEIEERGFQGASAKSIKIPSSVQIIGASAFRGCESLASISIPSSVKEIGSHAFYNCKSLASASISKSLETLGAYAFYNCTGLGGISLPASLRTVGEGAFFNCTSLLSAEIPSGVTEIGASVFKGCEKLTTLSLPFIGSKSTEQASGFIGYVFGAANTDNNIYFVPASLATVSLTSCTEIAPSAFKGCEMITAISLPASLASIGEAAFTGCTALEKVYIESLDGWCNVKFADASANPLFCGAALYALGIECRSLTIPGSVKSISPYAFYGCGSISVVTVQKGAAEIGANAFENCKKLVSVAVADSVTRIGANAFKGCEAIESLTLPFIGAEQGGQTNTHIGYIFGGKSRDDNELVVPKSLRFVTVTAGTDLGFSAFYGCHNINSISLPNGLLSIGNAAFSACTALTSIEIPETVVTIGESAFSYCTALMNVTVPNSVETMGNFAFYFCTSLTSVTLGESLTAVSNDMFKNCEKLCSVTFASDNAIASIGHQAFQGCKSLTSLLIPDGVLFIDSYAFVDCTALSYIAIPDSVQTVKDAVFQGCYSLTSVSVGNGIRAFGAGVFDGCPISYKVESYCNYLGNESNPYVVLVGFARNSSRYTVHTDTKTIAKGAFNNTGVRVATLPENLVGIGAAAFQGCRYLHTVNIPAGITVLEDSVFDGCVSLASIKLPAQLTYIGRFAFRDCISLTSLVLPDALQTIEGAAFTNCTKLATVVLGAGLKEIKQEVFSASDAITAVYYKSTASDFAKILIDPARNDSLTNAPIYYYSEIAPSADGNYWHYNESGNIEIWEN